MDENFKTLDNKFKDLVKEGKLNINSLEDLMIDNIEQYKTKMKEHMEELLSKEIDEKTLISKKNKSGKKKE